MDVGGDEADNQLLEALDADLVDKDVDEGGGHGWGLLVQFEEASVVALHQGVAGLQCVCHRLCGLVFRCQSLKHA